MMQEIICKSGFLWALIVLNSWSKVSIQKVPLETETTELEAIVKEILLHEEVNISEKKAAS